MNPQQMKQMMAKIGAAKPLSNRGQYVNIPGRHTVGVLSYEYKEPNGDKKILATDVVVLESIPAVAGGRTYSVGERLSPHWRMAGLDEWKAGKEMARAQAFVVSTLDAQGQIAQLNTLPKVFDPGTNEMRLQGELWLEQEAFKGLQPDQPLRGRVVVINAHVHVPKDKGGQPKQQATGKDPFVVVDWLPAPPTVVKDASGQPVRDVNGQVKTVDVNSPELIAARRAQWDQQFGPYVPFGAQAAAAATAAPSYGHAMQPAPAPTAPPPGYPYPGQVPGYPAQPQYPAPGQVPPGYPAPAQPQYPPQGYPPGVPQGYAPPQVPGYPVPAPAPIPGAVPPGYPQQGG